MMREDLRRKLSEIARGRPPAEAPAPAKRAPRRALAAQPIESLVPGSERTTSRGRHWRHERALAEVPGLVEAALALAPGALPDPERGEVSCLGGRGLEGALFLDLETCGFSGNPLFLTGALRIENGRPIFIQLLARHYAEEASVVEASLELVRCHPLLVTFNGKSYDMPFLRERAIRHGLDWVPPAGHLDLLHAARRRWKDVLPDCRLPTLEERLTGRRRAGDVPGSEAPERYHAFVRGGPASELVPVLRHNLLDLVTLVALLGALPGSGETIAHKS
jgi:uncharacterized protein YprB with RNaseH-like and TPR domain